MQNLTDGEMLLFIGFFILCGCVVFMLGLCFKHGYCSWLHHHDENHADTPKQTFASHFSSLSSPQISIARRTKKNQVWVDTTLKDDKHNL